MRITDRIDRKMLAEAFPHSPRLVRAFEAQAQAVEASSSGLETQAQATEKLQDASVIVLAPNGAFSGERVLVLGPGLVGVDNGSTLTIQTSTKVPLVNGDFGLTITLAGNSAVAIPLTGIIATLANIETLSNKTLKAPKITDIGDYADDAAASAGGVPVGGVYRTASVLKVRTA